MTGGSLIYTDGKVLVSYGRIKLGLSDGIVLGNIVRNVGGITIELNDGTYMVSLDGYFDGSNDGKLEVLFIGESLVSTGGKVLGTIIGNVDEITLDIYVGTEIGYLDEYFDDRNDRNLESLFLLTNWDIITVMCLALMKASNLEYPVVKYLSLYLEMYM